MHDDPTAAGRAFQVDLRGVVDLLARHLYSGPRVYVRELLQNGVDAITARRAVDPDAPATVRLRPGPGGTLEVTDSGVGLTPAQAEELLATVGRSSKRDLDLGLGREEFLGQFGIGLLSAFMVADEIELVSRSAVDPQAPPVRWVGYADGRYDLTVLPVGSVDVGSTVRLRARPDMDHWLTAETVVALAQEFGSLLPVDVAVEVPLPGDEGTAWRRVSEPVLPWRATYADDEERRAALAAYCERTLGFTPLAHIDLDVPLAGLSGVAYVLPTAVPPGAGSRHRVYLKRMLLGTQVEDLLPDWAFFVRCVVDTSVLRPTASREQLYTDDALLAAQEALAAQVRTWTVATLTSPSELSRDVVTTHHLALRSLAVVDDEVLDLTAQVLPFETTDGTQTLAQVRDDHGEVLHTTRVEDFRRVAPVARAQGMTIVNAGYVYDAELLARLARRPGWRVRELQARDVAQVLEPVEPHRELEVLDQVQAAREVVRPLDCDLVVRRFAPEQVPAVLLEDRDGRHESDVRRAVSEADDLWGGVLAGFAGADTEPARRLVLNDDNPTVRRLLAAAPDAPVLAAGVRSLYVTAVLLAGEPLRVREAELMNDAMGVLLEAGLPPASRVPDETQEDA
ncbi:ATP-binding region ATPase domain protein [Cellulomonas flavigena DSM 20109]|uniref:ATP-binding region ATPase domain protein n=1 Tax=Cellulomonas flavigena (strain ATCC 482 / DSM 20109 / BCRC 11376 / JCM 18109 / NBRC 3775 / NCIMB 8073 / NRS 134) TaxID=446466 RepID=D5UKY8_CELFN|nr:HSP90 family protein [Cellulomonas flavigena]ADG75870.1 ATP-binding region ATPase domain protein [Cellulomonas flavigena DSM 20109]